MIIFPAIDIKGCKCVLILKGDFKKVTQYEKTPLDQASIFSDLGFKYVHIIDLDGALEGKLVNKNLIEKILKNTNLKIQIGGGIRSLRDIKFFLDIGVDKVIIGTSAVENTQFLKEAVHGTRSRGFPRVPPSGSPSLRSQVPPASGAKFPLPILILEENH